MKLSEKNKMIVSVIFAILCAVMAIASTVFFIRKETKKAAICLAIAYVSGLLAFSKYSPLYS